MGKGRTTTSATCALRGVALAGLVSVTALTGCAGGGDGGETQVLSESVDNTAAERSTSTSAARRTSTTQAAPSTTKATAAPVDVASTAGEPHGPSRPACQHLRKLISNTASTATMSDGQTEQRVRQMADSAADATPAVRDGASRVLGAVIGDDAEAYLVAAEQMGVACTAAGF